MHPPGLNGPGFAVFFSLIFITIGFFVKRRLDENMRLNKKREFVTSYLPFLNAFIAITEQLPLDQLSRPLRDEASAMLRIIATTLFNATPHDDPRTFIAGRAVTEHHFYNLSIEDIRRTFPPVESVETLVERFSASREEALTDKLDAIRARGDIVLGIQCTTTPPLFHTYPDDVITIKPQDRFRHTYMIGRTGSGKTNLLKHIISQDMEGGQGLIVLSAENEIFENLLSFVPPERAHELVYIDPTDVSPREPIIGWNPFAFTEAHDLSEEERAHLLAQKAGETYTVFERAVGDLGVKMTTIMTHTAYTLSALPNATILDIDRLLDPNNPRLRRRIANSHALDERTKRFWDSYETSNYYKSAYESVVNRLDPFFRPPLSTFLSTNAFSFTDALTSTEPRIIFLNFEALEELPTPSST